MSDALPGLPDRYVIGGRWIEFKSLQKARRGFLMYEALSPEQRRQMTTLQKAGDAVFYCALLDDTKQKKIFFRGWDETFFGQTMDIEWAALYPDNDINRIIENHLK